MWADKDNTIRDAQFGFLPQKGTVEAICLLVHHYQFVFIQQKKIVLLFHRCQESFDTVNIPKLWKKLGAFRYLILLLMFA